MLLIPEKKSLAKSPRQKINFEFVLSFELERAPKIANQIRVFQIFELGAQNSFQFKNLCSGRHLLFFRFLFGFIQFSSKFNKILKKNGSPMPTLLCYIQQQIQSLKA